MFFQQKFNIYYLRYDVAIKLNFKKSKQKFVFFFARVCTEWTAFSIFFNSVEECGMSFSANRSFKHWRLRCVYDSLFSSFHVSIVNIFEFHRNFICIEKCIYCIIWWWILIAIKKLFLTFYCFPHSRRHQRRPMSLGWLQEAPSMLFHQPKHQ